MYEERYRFELVGITPLILHWDNIEWADQIEEERTRLKEQDKKNFKAGDDRCPPHTWKGCVYNDGEVVCLPTDNIRSALMKAAARITLSGKTSYKALSQSGMMYPEMFLPVLNHGKPIAMKDIEAIEGDFRAQAAQVEKLGFRLFCKRAAVGQAKHVRVRPRLDAWSIAGELLVTDEQLKEETLERMFNILGVYIGLCDWRPGSPKSPGPYGRCETKVTALG